MDGTTSPTFATTGLDPDFAGRLTALRGALGGNLGVTSGLRDSATQGRLYQQALAKYGDPAIARQWVAPPGHSMHEQGLAADLSGDLAGAHRLAGQFGLSFPLSNENWHIEPTGARSRSVGTMPTASNTKAAPNMEPYAGGLGLFNPAMSQINIGGAPQGQAADPYGDLLRMLRTPLPMPPMIGGQPMPDWATSMAGLPQVQEQMQPGFAGPPAMQNPSWMQGAQSLRQGAINAAPTPYDLQGLQARGQSAGIGAELAKLQSLPYGSPWQSIPGPQLGQLNQPSVPQRQPVRMDPMASAIGAIGGLLSPLHAGAINAAPIQGALGYNQMRYEDAQRAFQQAEQQAMLQHEAEKEQAQATYQNALMNSQMQEGRRSEGMKAGEQQAGLLGSQRQQETLVGGLPALAAGQREAETKTGLAGMLEGIPGMVYQAGLHNMDLENALRVAATTRGLPAAIEQPAKNFTSLSEAANRAILAGPTAAHLGAQTTQALGAGAFDQARAKDYPNVVASLVNRADAAVDNSKAAGLRANASMVAANAKAQNAQTYAARPGADPIEKQLAGMVNQTLSYKQGLVRQAYAAGHDITDIMHDPVLQKADNDFTYNLKQLQAYQQAHAVKTPNTPSNADKQAKVPNLGTKPPAASANSGVTPSGIQFQRVP